MDEEQQAASEATSGFSSFINGIGNFMRIMAKILKVAFKFVGSMIKWLFGFIAAHFPIFLIIMLIVIVLGIIMGVLTSVSSGGYNADNGTMSPVAGITGTEFYGQRYMYYDEEYTNENLADTYLEFTYNILYDVNGNSTINIDFSAPYSENAQIETITASFASAISGQNGIALSESVKLIDHYGFTEQEQQTALSIIANYIVGSGLVSVDLPTFTSFLNNSYNQNFAYMKNVCKKILIKDYILEEGKTAENISKEQYFGLVYMPKQMVTIEYASYAFVIENEKTVDIKMAYASGTSQNIIVEATADETWFVDGQTKKMLETEGTNTYILNEFTAIDKNDLNYFATEKTLFQVLKDGRFEAYFKNTNGDYSEEVLLKNVNSGNYLYMQLSADSPFNFAEVLVEVNAY